MGDDLSGEVGEEIDLDALGPEEIPAGEVGGGEAGGDESPLLAVPPGSRSPRKESKPTPKSQEKQAKGKLHFKEKYPKQQAGARSRHMSSKQQYSSTKRNTSKGTNDMSGLSGLIDSSAAAGIYNEEESIYNRKEQTEEDKLFSLNESIRSLIGSLEESNIVTESKDSEDKT